MAIAQNQSSEV